jgi:hypothetical protein
MPNYDLLASRVVFGFTPQAAGLTLDKPLPAAAVHFAFTPKEARPAQHHVLQAGAVSYAFGPQAAVQFVNHALAAERVHFAFSPQDISATFAPILFADPVQFAFAPQDADAAVANRTIAADPVVFSFEPTQATIVPTVVPFGVGPLTFPEFDINTAWTVEFYDGFIDFAGFSPQFGAFLVRYTGGAFTLWLRMPQGVVRGLSLATNKRAYLHNLGPPFLYSFLP